jgi:hypothetical protein
MPCVNRNRHSFSAPTLARRCNHHPRHWDAPWRGVQSPLGEYPPIHRNSTGGLVQVTKGKTKAARRMLPMVPGVYVALKARKEASGSLEEGWVFPASSREGPADAENDATATAVTVSEQTFGHDHPGSHATPYTR